MIYYKAKYYKTSTSNKSYFKATAYQDYFRTDADGKFYYWSELYGKWCSTESFTIEKRYDGRYFLEYKYGTFIIEAITKTDMLIELL